MSAYLLGVGFRADMGTCARKLVLLKMIDACEDDGTRIYPAVSTLAKAAQCSERTVQREIKLFLKAGLIRLVRQGGKGKGSTNEYALDLELLFRLARDGWSSICGEEVAPGTDGHRQGIEDGSGARASKDKGDGLSPLKHPDQGDTGDLPRVTKGALEGDRSCHPTPPVNPSCHPSGACAADPTADDHGEPTASVPRETWLRRFRKAHAAWPTHASDSPPRTQGAWFALSDLDRQEARTHQSAYLAHVRGLGRSKICAYSTYLSEKRWQLLPEAALGARAPKPVIAAPFGKLWGAMRFADLLRAPYGPRPVITRTEEGLIARGIYQRDQLLRGKTARTGWPKVNAMDERAVRRHIGLPGDPALAPLADLFGKVQKSSKEWAAWEELHGARGWPWFGADRDCPDWVWLPEPPGGPGQYQSLTEAVSAALARFETEFNTLSRQEAAQ